MEKKYLAAIAVIVMVVILVPVLANSVSQVVISSVGQVRGVVIAQSGSVTDIQAAVNQAIAVGASKVEIPSGNYTFNPRDSRYLNEYNHPVGVHFNIPSTGIEIYGAGMNQTRLQMPINDSETESVMFFVNGESNGSLRIHDLSLEGRPNYQTSPTGDILLYIQCCQDFRVYNCSFYYAGAIAVGVLDYEKTYGHPGGDYKYVSQGVVDHCNFYHIYKPACTNAGRGYGYGVSVCRTYNYQWTYNIYPHDANNNNDPWTTNDGFGKYYKNTYIEDCYFYYCRHATQANGGGAYVLRNSIIRDIGLYEVSNTGHPVREDTFGMFYYEIYNCTIIRTAGLGWQFEGPLVEGGSGLLYNNTLVNLDVAFELGSAETTNGCHYAPLGYTNNVYIWNNTVTNCNLFLNSHSNAPDGQPAPVENVDYFLHAPNASMAYTPYPYPHSLTLK